MGSRNRRAAPPTPPQAGATPPQAGGDDPNSGLDWLQNQLFGEPPQRPARGEPAPAAKGRGRKGPAEAGGPAASPPSLRRSEAAGRPDQGAIVWEVDRRALPMPVAGLQGHPHLAICVERATGFILATEVLPPDAPAEAVAAIVEEAARSGRPDVIAVMRPALAEVLQPALARAGLAGTPVVVARSLPAVTKTLRSFGQFLGVDFGAARRYWRDLSRAYPDVPGLMADAAAYFEAAPWSCLTDEHLVAARLLSADGASRPARTRYLCVLGALGETFGLVAFTTLAGYRAVAGHEGRRIPPVSMLCVTFDEAPELDEDLRARLARRYGVRNPAAFPFFVRQEGGGRRRLPTPDELDELRVWLRVLPAFVERHRAGLGRRTRLRSLSAAPLADRFAVTVGTIRFEAELEFPAGD